ncbi:hypothetical protein GCM10009788_55200 [Nocardioides humi]|uniref:Uncharacterized protein n=1 Tax=Nocardioides humi TaxID=449461 RepID=A0ABN2BTK8_9ACTN
MRRDVVDALAADPKDPAVPQGLQVLLSSSHGQFLFRINGEHTVCPLLRRSRDPDRRPAPARPGPWDVTLGTSC